MEFTPSQIEKMIYLIREHKVMLDSDLAKLYGVEVRALNQAVKRNISRFPTDFMFQITQSEREYLSSESKIFKNSTSTKKYLPYVFTENGVAMLSSVLKSEKAVQVNIAIMRIFTKLRSFLFLEHSLDKKIDQLETESNQLFQVVFERLDNLEKITPPLRPQRKKIGLKETP